MARPACPAPTTMTSRRDGERSAGACSLKLIRPLTCVCLLERFKVAPSRLESKPRLRVVNTSPRVRRQAGRASRQRLRARARGRGPRRCRRLRHPRRRASRRRAVAARASVRRGLHRAGGTGPLRRGRRAARGVRRGGRHRARRDASPVREHRDRAAPPGRHPREPALRHALDRRRGLSTTAATQEEKAAVFRALHEGEAFIVPNPWDAGSARVLEALGFRALATTSSGFAFTLGRLDGTATLDEVAEHVRLLAAATSLPISVDLENGYGPEPEAAATAIARAAGAGAVGGSIEDYDPDGGIYDLPHAAERVAAAREAADRLGYPFVLTGRAENHIRSNPDLDDTIARLQAYEAAGADVLYAPGLRSADEIRAVCEAVTKPVNVLARPDLAMQEIVAAGARRVSVGGALTWTAVAAMAAAAERMRDEGDFSSLDVPVRITEWLSG